MGTIKTICTEIEEAIDGGAERWEAVTDAIVRWEIDPNSEFARQLEHVYVIEPASHDDLPVLTSQELH